MKFTRYFRTPEGRIYGSDSADSFKDCERLTRAEGEKLHRQQVKKDLRELIKPGDTVYTCLRSVSASGMSRQISVHIAIVELRSVTPKEGETRKNKKVVVIRDVSGFVARILDYRQNDRNGALIVGGCGTDMGFHLVYSLARSLYPEKPGQRDGGYSLNHDWI